MGMPKVWVLKDTTFFAKYKINNWTVTFDANGGTGAMAPVSQDEGVFMLPENKFTPPSHYHFIGWSYEPTGETIPASFINLTSDVTLYAIYSIDTFKVSFWANGGVGTKDPIMVPYGDYTLPVVPFKSPGKKNIGWAYTPDGECIQEDTIFVTENINLYAIYQSIYISFNANGGFGYMTTVELQTETFLLPACKFAPAKEAQEFVGWAYKPEGPIIETPSITPKEDITLYAIWGDIYTVTLLIEDFSGRVKTTVLQYSTKYIYTLPKVSPFPATANAVWKWWSLTPNGEPIEEEKITITKDTTIYGVCDVIVTLDRNIINGETVKFQVEKSSMYFLPEEPPFSPPTGKSFEGWSYTPSGDPIEDAAIIIEKGIILYAVWGTGFDNWIQLLNVTSPVAITDLTQVYSDVNHNQTYKYNDHLTFWNNIELQAYEAVAPIEEVKRLPAYAPCDVIYHLTSNDTYWHYEYDVIKRCGGLPVRPDDDLFWEEITLIGLNSPRVSNNTQEVYFKSSDKRSYIFEYFKQQWIAQNTEVYGLLPDYEVTYNDMITVPRRPDRGKELYKVSTTYGDQTYYCWCRLVDEEYHTPPLSRIDKLCYWIIDMDWHLWIGNRPLIAENVRYQSYFNTATTYGTYGGPWANYPRGSIKYVTFLDDITPYALSHWFDMFGGVQAFYGMEHLRTDYCRQMTSAFVCGSCGIMEGIENLNIEQVQHFGGTFVGLWGGDGLDLSGWNNRSGREFENMFRDAKVTHVYVGDKWKSPPELGAGHYRMFRRCSRIHNWNGDISGYKAKIGEYFERKQVITFEGNGGKGIMLPKYRLPNEILDLPPCKFVAPENKVFLGWSYTSDGQPLKDSIIISDKDVTLYALWG